MRGQLFGRKDAVFGLPWKLARYGWLQGQYGYPTYLLIRRDSVVRVGPGKKSRSPEILCNTAPDLPKYVSGDQNHKPLKGNFNYENVSRLRFGHRFTGSSWGSD
jgi:hypothetical protein